MADVAEPRGPAGAGAGGPVVAGTSLTAVTDRTGAGGSRRSETGVPVVTGIRFQTGTDRTEASGPAVTVAGGSVDVEKGFRPASEIAEADVMTGTGTGGPVVVGMRFLAVAEVYAPIEETEGDERSDIRKFDQNTEVITKMTSPHQLKHTSARGETVVRVDMRGKSNSENGAHFMDPDGIRRTSDTEQVVFSPMDSSKKVIETVDTDSTEGPEGGTRS